MSIIIRWFLSACDLSFAQSSYHPLVLLCGQCHIFVSQKRTFGQTPIFMVIFHYLLFLAVYTCCWGIKHINEMTLFLFHFPPCHLVVTTFYPVNRSLTVSLFPHSSFILTPSTHSYSLNSPTLLDTTHGSIFSQVVHRNEHIIPPILLALTFLLLPTPPLFLTELMPTNSLHNNTQHVTRINQHNITPHFLLCWLLEVRMIFPDAHTSWTDVVLAEPPMETLSSPNIIIIRWFFLTCGRFSLERKKRWGWWTTWL